MRGTRRARRSALDLMREHCKAALEGFAADEFCGAVELLNLICMRILRRDPASEGMRQQILDYLTMTLRYGCDQAQETFEELSIRGGQWQGAPGSTSFRRVSPCTNQRQTGR